MDMLKLATDWARAEVFSSTFFIIFGVVFILAGVWFWQLWKTQMAKAYILPTLIAGGLLLIIGIGIFFANKTRTASFVSDYNNNVSAFVESEIVRTEKSMNEYRIIVFKVIPFIILVCALCIVFIDKSTRRASMMTIIAMMVVILLVDSNANARLELYHDALIKALQ